MGFALLLAGCSGGQVAIRSGVPVAAPAAGAQVSVSGGSGLALAILLGMVLADGIHWLTSRGSAPEEQPGETRRSLWQPIDRGWVDRGP